MDARVVLDIDVTAVEMLGELRDGLAASGVGLAVAGTNDRVLEQLWRGGALDRLGGERVFRRLADGVAAFESRPAGGSARMAHATGRPGRSES